MRARAAAWRKRKAGEALTEEEKEAADKHQKFRDARAQPGGGPAAALACLGLPSPAQRRALLPGRPPSA